MVGVRELEDGYAFSAYEPSEPDVEVVGHGYLVVTVPLEQEQRLGDGPCRRHRHLTLLINAGVLDVVAERKVRGTVERTYVKRGPVQISRDELATMSRDDHRRALLAYVAALLADIDLYLDRDQVDFHRDGVACRIMAMWLNDQELTELASRFAKLLKPYLEKPPTPDRTRRILRIVSLPGSGPDDRS